MRGRASDKTVDLGGIPTAERASERGPKQAADPR
jgi:hypothetical protein